MSQTIGLRQRMRLEDNSFQRILLRVTVVLYLEGTQPARLARRGYTPCRE